MIYITGDTHGSHDFDKLRQFADKNPQLTRDDYMIVAGDFGGVWDPKTLEEDLKPFIELPYTVLFVDGNHENFDMLGKFPIRRWNGGAVHKIAENVIHLMRGQVYDIDGKLFFTFGGATSRDKSSRTEGINWWRQEEPTEEELIRAQRALDKVCFTVDYIVTHSCDEQTLRLGKLNDPRVYPENALLAYFETEVQYKHWYFGHYHLDLTLNDKKTVLYNSIVRIDT